MAQNYGLGIVDDYKTTTIKSIEVSHLEKKISELRSLLSDYKQVLVCYSGGVDSSYLLAEAVRSLNKDALAFTAISPSLPRREAEEAKRLANKLGARHLLVETHEVDDPRYAANPLNRCYFCKNEVYRVAVEEAKKNRLEHIIDGFNRDDRGDHRPGRRAAQKYGVLSPLDELGFRKVDVRISAQKIGLPVWDKPALACLSSRFPYGTKITPKRLKQIGDCEAILQKLGFRTFRVRYQDTVAQIEVGREELFKIWQPAIKKVILQEFRKLGFTFVNVDLHGYRRGSMNEKTKDRRDIVPLETGGGNSQCVKAL